MFQILIVEDFKLFRQFVCSIVRGRGEFQVTEASDGLEAVRKAERLKPDLILLDLGLPNINGMEVANRVRKLAPSPKILFLSQESSPDVVREALNRGAQGYIQKLHARTELLPAIDAVLKGRSFVSNGLREVLTFKGRPTRGTRWQVLRVRVHRRVHRFLRTLNRAVYHQRYFGTPKR